jgi:hypothetical protein
MAGQLPEWDEDEVAGDAVCWLAGVCVECGALIESGDACWRCGTPRNEE